MSAPVAIYYASHDGHTRLICERLAQLVREEGTDTQVCDLVTGQPTATDLKQHQAIVIAAAIRYGHHLPPAEAFLSQHQAILREKPLAVLSVNLTARKPGKNTPEGNVYLRKWLKRHRLTPTISSAVAGRLDYARYRWFDRMMIRLIMKITGGPTQADACVEYTDWDHVATLARQIAALAQEHR